MKVSVVQMACGENPADNLAKAGELARRAAGGGARIILLPELFERPYFCKTQRAEFYEWAQPAAENPAVLAMQKLAAELSAVLPVSFYERAGNALFNSLAVINADGALLGVYRKSHLPDGPGYQEKFYFSPGDTGFRVWETQHCRLGAAVCWDQWFPETARAMALSGAELFAYPSAIGSEPHLEAAGAPHDSSAHWQTAMRGHAAANMIPLIAANRVGCESQTDAFGREVRVHFYGESFIADECGKIVAQAARDEEDIIFAELDFAEAAKRRAAWGVFRDRRPELYGALLSLDGKQKHGQL